MTARKCSMKTANPNKKRRNQPKTRVDTLYCENTIPQNRVSEQSYGIPDGNPYPNPSPQSA